MHPPSPRRPARASRLLCALAIACATGCGWNQPASDPVESAPAPLADAIPPEHLAAVLAAHYEGAGRMGQFDYAGAAEKFRAVRKLAPGWIPGSINLAIALLNDTGAKAEAAKAEGQQYASNFDEALALLDAVLVRDPDNLHAHYCRGVILQYLGGDRIAEAHEAFAKVVESDPNDAHAWMYYGSTLPLPEESTPEARKRLTDRQLEIFGKSVACNPYLVPALYYLSRAEIVAGHRDKYDEITERFLKLDPEKNPAGSGDEGEQVYGQMGKYASLIHPGPPPDSERPGTNPSKAPRFDRAAPLTVELAAGDRWGSPDDFQGPTDLIGRARSRFGPALAAFDADGDGKLDLYLAAAVTGPDGVRDALLLNAGDGRFVDASAGWGLPADRASLGVAAGDFDADRRIDLFLTAPAGNRLLRNDGSKFLDVTDQAGVGGAGQALGLTARWLDLDQDGDLDLYVVNYTTAEGADSAFSPGADTVAGATNAAFRNDGRPEPASGESEPNWAPDGAAGGQPTGRRLSVAFTPWPEAESPGGPPARHTGVAMLDVDDDRDLDLVLAADDAPLAVAINDRLGRFRMLPIEAPDADAHLDGLLATDLDADGRADLVGLTTDGRVLAWANRTKSGGPDPATAKFDAWPTGARGWRPSVAAADLDLDGRADLLGISSDDPGTAWARNEPTRLVAAPLPLPPSPDASRPTALLLADLIADPLPDLLVLVDGQPPSLARSLGNSHRWLALDFGGRWRRGFDHMRTNPHGLGVTATLQGPGLNVPYVHTTTASGLAQSVAPAVLGLGDRDLAPVLALRWPDGVLQSELNLAADRVVPLGENNRKTGSCPVLFTWDGQRFVCLGDFLGGGGLGYLVAPGVYGEPDRDEAVAIPADALKPINGRLRMAIAEPMDEVAYLDRLRLEVIDRPPGVEVAPDERFAPGGNRPTGELWAWTRSIRPERATDLAGADLTDVLARTDRVTADGFKLLRGWIGYAEEHGIVLDFGNRLADLPADAKLVLGLSGWVEYPYSQTNYAAATAGVPLSPPVLERRQPDGTWKLIEADPGYPAGLPRLTTLELTGRVGGPDCVLRLRTNMECYWDEAFLAVATPADRESLRTTTIAPDRATLGPRGYLREVSPDGRLPLLYDYAAIDPAPLAPFAGRLTRFGPVAPLIAADDDQLCTVGPGDELRLEFAATTLPSLPAGWTRSYVLRAEGYCKDADPFTAASDTVGPLPWRGMPTAYPFGREGERPADPTYDSYLNTYQTRPAGAGDEHPVGWRSGHADDAEKKQPGGSP